MKNLTIFVLTLIALSSVCSLKLNKVLKEEKVLSVTPQIDTDNKVETETQPPKGGRKVETSVNNVVERTKKTETSLNAESDAEETQRGKRKVEAENLVKATQGLECNMNDMEQIKSIESGNKFECTVGNCDDAKVIYELAEIINNTHNVHVFDKNSECL